MSQKLYVGGIAFSTTSEGLRAHFAQSGTVVSASIVTDQFGHGMGGMRTPFIEVPLASYATNSPGPGNCREMGRKSAFEASRLESLYGNEKSYAAKVAQSVDRLVKEHWLTDAAARRIKQELTRR